MTKGTKVSFAGERIYCGIDVHKLSWRVNIRSEEFELEDFWSWFKEMEFTGEELRNAFEEGFKSGRDFSKSGGYNYQTDDEYCYKLFKNAINK